MLKCYDRRRNRQQVQHSGIIKKLCEIQTSPLSLAPIGLFLSTKPQWACSSVSDTLVRWQQKCTMSQRNRNTSWERKVTVETLRECPDINMLTISMILKKKRGIDIVLLIIKRRCQACVSVVHQVIWSPFHNSLSVISSTLFLTVMVTDSLTTSLNSRF